MENNRSHLKVSVGTGFTDLSYDNIPKLFEDISSGKLNGANGHPFSDSNYRVRGVFYTDEGAHPFEIHQSDIQGESLEYVLERIYLSPAAIKLQSSYIIDELEIARQNSFGNPVAEFQTRRNETTEQLGHRIWFSLDSNFYRTTQIQLIGDNKDTFQIHAECY